MSTNQSQLAKCCNKPKKRGSHDLRLTILGKQVIFFYVNGSTARNKSITEHIKPDTFIQISPIVFSSYEL